MGYPMPAGAVCSVGCASASVDSLTVTRVTAPSSYWHFTLRQQGRTLPDPALAAMPAVSARPNAAPAGKSGSGGGDLYSKMKVLQRQLEFLEIQEEYIKDEMQNLKRELGRAKEEVKRIQSVPLVIGQFLEIIDRHHGIVSSTTGSNYYVRILSTINRELLKPGASVALHRHSNAVVDVLPPEADSAISMLGADEKPNVSYNDIGGCASKTDTCPLVPPLSSPACAPGAPTLAGELTRAPVRCVSGSFPPQLRPAEAGDSRGRGAAPHAPRPVLADWH